MSMDGYVQGRKAVNRTVVAQAPAKVNLHLEILRQRHDGYHEIETVFQAVALFDEVRVTLADQYPGGEPDILVTVEPKKAAPADETNLCWQAARHFCREMKLSGRILIHLEKKIPSAAGLGGGSSDAAAVLLACNRLFKTGLDLGELEKLAAPLGADVPFFIRGATAMGRGTGTQLTPLPAIRTGQFLIVKPGMELRTSEVYSHLKMGLTVNSAKANIQVMKSILARFPQKTWPGFNRLEEVVLPQQPALQRLVLELRELAPVAMMSGSGSAVVAVFPERQDLEEIVGEFRKAGLFVSVVGPHAAGPVIRDDHGI
jgi:4-diphosphocytidyl-2-C-methyl-D-erythritol kinase|nr:4-(cytidine 5'-diphospho)-2-C-methyl-D-erythritol kinase [Candidatus Krumholzibacteria bacterium]